MAPIRDQIATNICLQPTTMKILATNPSSLESLRRAYFNTLPQFQELYLELMVENANSFLLLEAEETVGYAIVTHEKTLIEFYLHPPYIPESARLLAQTIAALQVERILCKSFDALLLNGCLLQQYAYSLEGCLYRDYLDDGRSIPSTIRLDLADESAIELIQQHQDCFAELFEREEYLRRFLQHDQVFLCYQGRELVGCGTLIRTHPNWNYCDLGVWVQADFRRQRIGTQVIDHLRRKAIQQELHPSCGCAMDNIASQKTIEKAGLVSRYKLIEFRREG